MKFLIICNGYPDKRERNIYIFVHRQALALKRAGHEVVVLDIDLRSIRWKRRFGQYFEEYEKIPVYRFSFPFVTVKFLKLYSILNKFIGRICAKKIFNKLGRADFICPHFARGAGEAASAIKAKYNIPIILTEHSSKILMDKNNEIERYSYVYKNVDSTIVVSKALKEKLSERGINSTVLPNVIDVNLFKPIRLIKEDPRKVFLSVGRMDEGKRFDLFLKAFSMVSKKRSDVCAILIGDGILRNEIKSLADSLKLTNVSFINNVANDKMPEYYSSADCFVLASDFETFGMVYAEAIACGTPAIGTDNGGAPEIISSNCGLIIPKNNVEALAEAMIEVINTPYDRLILHNNISERFGEEQFVKVYLDICRKVLEQNV